MKKASFLALVVLAIVGQSCSKCIKCESTYTGETETHIDEWCDDATLDELNELYQNREDAGDIESGWDCK
jgi:hypothetical protein